uniref:Fibronectin type-III domain-containing protein n=1 Tax=Macrostomum lignano TaxID=282301 RepID=A0A1I8FG44_9PLAT
PPKLTGLDCEWPNRESENFRCLSRPNLRSVWEATNIVKTAGKVHLLDRFRVPPVPEEWRTCSAFGALGAGCQCNSEGRCRWLRVAEASGPLRLRARGCNRLGWCGGWVSVEGDRRQFEAARPSPQSSPIRLKTAQWSPNSRRQPSRTRPASETTSAACDSGRGWTAPRIGPVASETVENSTVRLSARARGRETYTAEYFRLPGNSGWSEPAEAKISTPVWPPCPPRLALLLERRNFVWLSAPPAECRHGPIVSYRLRLGGGGAGRNSKRGRFGQSTNLMASATTSAGEGRTMPVLLAEWLSECPDGWAAGQLELQMLWLRNTENDSVRDATAALARWRLPAAVTVEPPLAIATCEPAANRASATLSTCRLLSLSPPSTNESWTQLSWRQTTGAILAPAGSDGAGSRCVCRQRAEPLPDDALSGRLVLPKVQLLRLNDNGGDGGSGPVRAARPVRCRRFEVADAAGPLANCSRQRQPPTSARFRCPLPASLSHRPPLQLLARL